MALTSPGSRCWKTDGKSAAMSTPVLPAAKPGVHYTLRAHLAAVLGTASGAGLLRSLDEAPRDVQYTNLVIAAGPWSIHVVRVPRSNPLYSIQSTPCGFEITTFVVPPLIAMLI
jgi:hypothetical protein